MVLTLKLNLIWKSSNIQAEKYEKKFLYVNEIFSLFYFKMIALYRDILLLYEKDKSTEKNLEQVALVICHEVSHQVG
jgi:uncharacterized membrane protein YesL